MRCSLSLFLLIHLGIALMMYLFKSLKNETLTKLVFKILSMDATFCHATTPIIILSNLLIVLY